MGLDVKETEMELSMTDQMMRIIKNRNLMTKFIMFILILFMGMADLLLLYVKLTWILSFVQVNYLPSISINDILFHIFIS